MVIIAKNAEIGKRKPAQSREAICNSCRRALEILIVEENIQYNFQNHEQRVEIMDPFGDERARPTCKRP